MIYSSANLRIVVHLRPKIKVLLIQNRQTRFTDVLAVKEKDKNMLKNKKVKDG